MFRDFRILPLAALLATFGLLSAAAQNKPMPMNVTPEREAAVQTFVERNHPELSELLTHLKANKPQEYERAIRELHRITERLAGIQERDRTQYDLEIKLWTAQSRVQLFTAKLRMDSTDDLKNQLREALNAQAEAKVALLKHERVRVAGRLSKIDADIAQFENDRQRVIDKQMDLLTRSATERKAAQGRGPKAAAKTAAVKPGGKQGGKRANPKPTTNANP